MRTSPEQTRETIYSPAILLLILVVGISYLGFGFIMPLRALYGRSIGASSVEIGLMASSFLLAGFFAAPIIGWLADRFSYRTILCTGLFLHTALMLAYIPVNNPVLLIVLRAIEGVAATSVLPPARALMNSLAPRTRQGEALGLVSAAQAVGILIGPAVGSVLASQVGYTVSFLIASVPLALGAAATIFLLPAQNTSVSSTANAEVLVGKRKELFSRPLLITYLLGGAVSIPQGIGGAIWSLYMLDRGASLPLTGLSYTTFALPIILVTPFVGRISDHYGRYWPLVLGLFLLGLTYWLYSLPITPLWIVLISLLEGVALAIARSAIDGHLADVMPVQAKGKVQANYSAASTAGALFGATIAGWLYAVMPGTPFLVLGIIFFSVLGLMFLPASVRIFASKHNG